MADEFQLPMLGLYADLEMGVGSVHLPNDFLQCSSGVQLEVIKGWQQGLERHRRAALAGLYRQVTASRPGLDEDQRLDLFRATCQALGVELPANFEASALDR